MPRVLLFHKPFQVLSQFTSEGGKACLADYIDEPDIYPAGRLDFDSEGLLLLTADGRLAQRITNPRQKSWKTYLVQVDGVIDPAALQALQTGVTLKDGPTLPARARAIAEPDPLWPRDPPVRYRKSLPTSWLELQIREGRNRQVRRMCAQVGFPCLRLIRWRIGDWDLTGLAPGAQRWLAVPDQSVGSQSARGPKRRRRKAR